ncbi:T9SS type A sorting domain-containing protein [Chitinophaga sedimenti]|uniref:T9SS type A sorting domain-containing protein n=1 Tax=Chitinophaga sedimenti TaxID=2033606 RepID=UPI0020050D56|nr:T9SS type A sorting domain-containing protein [Chitinophaga sedimenti]MCK7558092.1 T9SS type A sorting domain-containing protein [Chitinophaga sedimenti]
MQRKTATTSWKQIADVQAFGNSTTQRTYNYTDTLTSDTARFYRLHFSDSTGRQYFTDSIYVLADSGYWKPFVWQNFAVLGTDTAAQLSWQTKREKYAWQFVVQRSAGTGWVNIDTMPAAGRSATLRNYTSADYSRFSYDVHYRLEMEDSLNRSFYSDSIKLLKPQPAFVLDSFSVSADWDQRKAGWKTSSEYNALKFYLERSADSLSWSTVGTVNATGTSSTPRYYMYVDKPVPQQVFFYRLHMEDNASRHFYSAGVKVQPDPAYAQPFTYSGPAVSRQNNLPYLQWSTTKEKNTLHFTVQRRLAATSWTTAGTVSAAGNSNTLRQYNFTDNSVFNEDVFYRLKMEDTSQRSFYTDSVKLEKLVLPFVLTAFSGAADYDQRNLSWSTSSENGSLRFIVERSADSLAWSARGNVTAAGTASAVTNYTYADKNVTQQVWYYRLHMEDTSGVHTYSAGIKIQPDPLYAQPFTYAGPTVTKVGSFPYVQWSTTREKNTSQFTVERSFNNTSWTSARIVAAAGNSTTTRNYNYTDSTAYTQNVYYRLKMEDTARRVFYSASVMLAYATGPFNLTSFSVTRDYDDAYMAWSTASETNTAKFVLQRSSDSSVWQILSFVNAAGTSTTTRSYAYKDPLVPSQTFFYRLKMETTNGAATYSPVVKAAPDPVQLQPINLGSFTALLVAGKPNVSWTTTIEKESSKWLLQRSTNGWSWTTVNTQNAAGRTLTGASYSYNDNFTVTAATYYRLQLKDSASRSFNSASITVTPGSGARLAFAASVQEESVQPVQLAPNPTSGNFRILGLPAGVHNVDVFNSNGQLKYRDRGYEAGSVIDGSEWTAGVYYVLVDDGNIRLRLIKQ